MRKAVVLVVWASCVGTLSSAEDAVSWRTTLQRFHQMQADNRHADGVRLLAGAVSAEKDPLGRATLHYWLGVSHHDAGNYPTAERAYKRASEAPALRATSLTDLAVLYLDSNRQDLALRTVDDALSLAMPAGSPERHRALRARSIILSSMGRSREAEDGLREILAQAKAGNAVERASMLNDLATAVTRQNRPAEAIALLTESIDLLRSSGAKAQLPRQLMNLAEAQFRYGSFAAAGQHSAESIALVTELYGNEHPDLAYAYSVHAKALKALGRREEAKAAKTRGEELARGLRSSTVDRYELGLR